MDIQGFLSSRQTRAGAGAMALHLALFSVFRTWHPLPLPPAPETIPVILVEVPALIVLDSDQPSEIEPETEIDLIDDTVEPDPTSQYEPEPQPEVIETEEPPQPRQPALAAKPVGNEVETSVSLEQAPPDGTPDRREGAPASTSQDEKLQVIDPQYVYKYDPFAEIAPTGLARFTRALNCARTNRDTRPAFCPDYDDDDLYIATFTRNRPEGWEQGGYDPVLDIATARSALGNFKARQIKPQFTGRSEGFGRSHLHDPSLPDQGCRYISSGGGDPFALDQDAAIPDRRLVVCDQEK